jgi:hypothetical protein
MNHKRKKLFIDKQVQGALVRQLVLRWIIAGFLIFLFLLVIQIVGSGANLNVDQHMGEMWAKYGGLLLAVVLVFPLFIYDSIKLGHRLAGPIFSFRRALSTLAQGKPIRPIQFRDDDFWSELTDDLNKIAERMGLTQESQQPSNN